jgi:Nitrate and nitrite sensing/Histidine kinase-, DNA gyrase B-, and HSP90-like ATPase
MLKKRPATGQIRRHREHGRAPEKRWAPSIRIRVLAIALIPSAVLLAVGGTVAATSISQSAGTDSFASQTLEWVEPIVTYLSAVENERTLSLRTLGGDQQARAGLQAQWAATDAALGGVNRMTTSLQSLNAEVVVSSATESEKLVSELPEMRRSIQSGHASAIGVDSYYTQFANVGMGTFLAYAPKTPNSASGAAMITTMDLFAPIDLRSRVAGLGSGWLAHGALNEADRLTIGQLTFAYRFQLQSMLPRLTAAEKAEYERLATDPAWKAATSGEDTLAEHGALAVPVTTWLSAEDQTSAGLLGLWADIFRTGLNGALSSANRALSRSILIGSVVLVLSAGAFVASLTLANAVTRRLRRLRTKTLELAEVTLPAMVRRIGEGQAVDIEAEVTPLDQGSDEIGEVARAFATAQRTAVEAAAAEARTRGGINKVFLDIAHRSQLVVHRQLELLDVAEARQPEPEHLELLFQLDHLATRARRNAENLLILGGGQPGRRWRNPAALEDVVRSAVSETEHFTRVSTVRLPSVRVQGSVVGDLIHLLAELVDNATSFSPPDSEATVRGNVVGKGVVVEIEDQGLGIEHARRDQLNETLRKPPDFQAMALSGQRHLGLFVTGQLAQRHGIAVSLVESAYGGVKAIVLIPASAIETVGGGEGSFAPPPRRDEQSPGSTGRIARDVKRGASGGDGVDSLGQTVGIRSSEAAAARVAAAPPWELANDSGQPSRRRAPLPRRERLTNLAPGLRPDFDGDVERAVPVNQHRTPEHARGSMSAFQQGTRRGRDVAHEKQPRNGWPGDEQ